MSRRLFNQKLIPRGLCKQKMKWKCILGAILLLTLLINEVELHGIGKDHSKKMRLEPWGSTFNLENLPRHYHSKKVDQCPTSRPEGRHRRKPRVGNTHHLPPLKDEEHRHLIIKGGFQPVFAEELANLSVARGRDARFKCIVDNLGGYKVGWVKVDTKAIQAIHDHVITHNPRVSVSHSDHATWYLLIKKVEESDRGMYMCQVNTDPMIYQMSFLEILHPPDFDMLETSSSIEVQEGSPLKLQCKAFGRPKPRIIWRRENNTEINIRDADGNKVKVENYYGEVLDLPKMMRSDMGNYMCIATNGVPPTIIKTIRVTVRFHPMVQVPNQLVGAPLGTDITLVCFAEAYPRSINYWLKDGKGELVFYNKKYDVELQSLSDYELNMTLKIRNLTERDMGSYNCVSKNPVGEVSSQIRVYEITDDRSSNPLNKAYRGGSNDVATKKPKRPVKLLRPANVGNAIRDENAKMYNPKQPRLQNRAKQSFPYVCYLYLSLIFYLIV
ncbi:lachesin-like isoform X2 [Agrilus planipennis]|uniref:Lachesin-like isoform X2 n=1 Tax=Agrilus planipennis TaxID=224129 RepID=A0A1W4WT81_AGRPL|nr:lachesin-like isoform X2 [Agrilus planipennis]